MNLAGVHSEDSAKSVATSVSLCMSVREPVHANGISHTKDGSIATQGRELGGAKPGTHHLLERNFGLGNNRTGLGRVCSVRSQRLDRHEQYHEKRMTVELFGSQNVPVAEEIVDTSVGTDGLKAAPHRCGPLHHRAGGQPPDRQSDRGSVGPGGSGAQILGPGKLVGSSSQQAVAAGYYQHLKPAAHATVTCTLWRSVLACHSNGK